MDRKVKLIPHTGKNLVTGQIQYFHQWNVVLCENGADRNVGILGWAEDAQLLFTVPVDPPTTLWIKSEVSKQVERDAEFTACPEIPAYLLKKSEGDLDEFDETDLVG